MKKLSLFFTLLLAFACSLAAQTPIVVKLWPNGAPTKNGNEGIEETRDPDGRIAKVSDPELWIYPAAKPNGQAIVMCPGGGYKVLSSINEGTSFANWMNTQGITYAVLKYRLPNGHSEVPLEDTRRAMEIMRSKAKEYKYSPNKVGIMGASAGGHCAATLATLAGDAAHRPNFQILLYPVISMTPITHAGSKLELLGENPSKDKVEKYSLENRVTSETPQAFIVLTADDKIVDALNSVNYTASLLKNKVPVSLHIYPHGPHGFGFKDTFPYKHQYAAELERWLRDINK